MADETKQAQAASQEAENQTAAGQETDAVESQHGTNPLAAYEAELARAMAPAEMNAETQEESGEGEESAEEQADEQDAEESAQEEQAEESSDEEESDEGTETVTQMRPRLKDPLDIAVAALAKAKGISLVDAAAIVAGQQQPKTTTEREEAAESQQAVETAESVSAKIKELIASKKEKLAALEFEEAADIDAQIEDMRDKRDALKEVEAKEKSRTEAAKIEQFEQKFTQSETTAIQYYPDAANHDSPLAKRMAELDQQAKELDDPIFYSPEKPFLLAKAAARELGILMTKPGSTPPAKKVVKRPIQPAGGNARTSAPANATSQIDQAIASVKDEAAYEKVLAQLGV